MTGRDLILYILRNGLENEPVAQNGKLIGFLTIEDAAIKFDVGTATIGAWIELGMMESVRIGDTLFIPDIYDKFLKEIEHDG